MRNKLIVIIALIANTLSAQTTSDSLLLLIEKNNSTLRAIKESTEAEKTGNQTGIFLKNPEAEFNYLWGHPAFEGNRADINITQSFDFPTAYKYRKQLAGLKNDQADLAYDLQRQSVLFEARMLITELIYYNALSEEISKRVENALKLADAYGEKYENGEANILELNRARLNLAGLENELVNAGIQHKSIIAELTRLNGGNGFDMEIPIQMGISVEKDFDIWYSDHESFNPVLKYLNQQIRVSEAEEKLNSALTLPKFNTGYMSERLSGQVFQGFTLGISIPLWENKNMARYAKAKTRAAQSREYDARVTIYNKLKMIHARLIALQENTGEYRNKILELDNSRLLEIALDAGEISLVEYLFELALHYESIDRLLELEKNLRIAIAEMYQYGL